ncbi:hypothetical protein NHH82_01920 [Oxalobacteraceae bacterium OTU3REALA1]|jgi:hypothetical protein|nr:hypothetical protein NHH82_01920 [Oxalobacteraceae bacterium OTU3REALA1]
MHKKISPSTLSMECSDWAASFAKRSSAKGESPQFYAFKPRRAPTACFLGDFTDKDGNFFNPSPSWQWHVAVELNGLLYDEIHPMGVPVNDYLAFFKEIDFITVTAHSDLPSAVESANGWIRPHKW